MLADRDDCFVLVVDIQESFRGVIEDFDHLVNRTAFLIEAAQALGVPVWITEQNPAKLGETAAEIMEVFEGPAPYPKMTFSALGVPELVTAMDRSDRNHAILVGIETHICMAQTAYHWVSEDHEVSICADATGARTQEANMIALDRLRDIGVTLTHTESVVYEWLGSAAEPEFKELLPIVKKYAG